MTEYDPSWELESVPDKELWSEVGRRRSAQSTPKPKKTEPCVGCGLMLGVVERRGKCYSCGASQPRVKVRKKGTGLRKKRKPQPR